MVLSVDLRERVIAAVDDGMHIEDAVKVFKVCRRVIYNWLDLREKSGSLVPKSGYQKGHSHQIKDWDQFKAFAAANQNYTSPTLRVKWQELTGVAVSENVMLSALKKIGFTHKKKLLTTRKPIKKNVNIF